MARQQATAEQRAEVRERIRTAAAAVYRAEGLGRVSARAIAQEAGVSVGTLYSYFENLQDLMQSLWMEPVERFEQRLRSIALAHEEPLERIESLLRAYVAFALRRPELYRSAFLFVRPEAQDKPLRQALEESVFGEWLVRSVAEGQRAGSIRDGSPPVLAQLAWSALHGAIALPTNIDRIAFRSTKTIAAEMIDVVLDHLRARPAQ